MVSLPDYNYPFTPKDFKMSIKFDTFAITETALMKSSELVRRIKAAGWIEIRQKGSHKIFVHKDYTYSLPVPAHGTKEVATGTANAILKRAGLK